MPPPPTFLTDPTTVDLFAMGAAAMAGTALLDAGIHADDDESKAYALIASGVSILVGVYLLREACGSVRRGFCSWAP